MTGRESFVAHLERRLGLSFTGAQQTRMLAAAERLRARAGVPSTEAYRQLVEHDPAAFDELVAALTVGETHFFRDLQGIAVLQHQALPELAYGRDPGDRIEVWSAGCATGEEAYTMAMAAGEVGHGRRVRVLGTDLSSQAIAKARGGMYGPWSLRGVDANRRRSWFRQDGRHHHVHHTARHSVRFAAMNILDGPPGRFDVVVCRNVLIYFTPEALQRAAQVLHDALRPGGWLLTGPSDPALTIEGLQRSAGSAVVYRRVDDRPAAGVAPDPPQPPRRFTPTTPVARTAQAAAAHAATVVRALGGAGKGDDALAVASKAIAEDPLDPELRYLAAVLHLEAGRLGEAAAAARAALFLAPHLDEAAIVLRHARPSTDVAHGS